MSKFRANIFFDTNYFQLLMELRLKIFLKPAMFCHSAVLIKLGAWGS